MTVTIEFEKGDECYDVEGEIKNHISRIINSRFEDVDACLKSDIKVKIEITALTGDSKSKLKEVKK